MADGKCTFGEIFIKTVDENGEEHFKPLRISDCIIPKDEDCSFDLDEAVAEYDMAEVKALCARTLREKYFLEGMVAAYSKVLGIDDADDDE
jgi:hypothetical protein